MAGYVLEDGKLWYVWGKKQQRQAARYATCPQCGTEFPTQNLQGAVFCSRRCARIKNSDPRHLTAKPPNRGKGDDRYYQDQFGRWWYRHGDGKEILCKVNACVHCKEEYVTSPYHAKQTRYCSRSCSAKDQPEKRGEKARRWRGGRRMQRGYVMLYAPGHHSIPPTTRRQYVLEHRLVMEKVLGRPLEANERVHHKNGVKNDNRPENLELWRIGHPPGQRATEAKHCPTCTCVAH